MNFTKKKMFGILKIIIIVYCLLGIAIYYLQDYILFRPQTLDSNYVFSFNKPFEEIKIPLNSEDTIDLVKFFPKDSVRRGVVLYFHGNMKNINRYAEYSDNFTNAGYEVWIEDYPGFGKSTGTRTEEKMYSQALQVQKMAAAKYATDSIIIYGKSLGTGVAAYVASETKCKRLILETPYYSVPAVFSAYGAFIFPLKQMIKYKLPTFQYLQDVKVPVSIFYGTSDWIIPYRCTKKLKPYLKPGDEFIAIPDAGHNTLNDKELFHQKLDSLLK